MNRRELVHAVAAHTGIESREVDKILRGTTEVIEAVAARGEQVTITGFAKFARVDRPARMARNPGTGEPVRVKASKKAKITPLKGFKDAVMTSTAAPRLARGVWPPFGATSGSSAKAPTKSRAPRAPTKSRAPRAPAKSSAAKAPATAPAGKSRSAAKAPATAPAKSSAAKSSAAKAPAKARAPRAPAKSSAAKAPAKARAAQAPGADIPPAKAPPRQPGANPPPRNYRRTTR